MDKETAEKAIVEQGFSLEMLVPEDQTLKIGEKEYEIRKINLQDEVWMKQFGDIQHRLNAEDMDFSSKLCFRLLKDKSDFLPIEVADHDDEGNPIQKKITGPQRILMAMSGPKARFEMMQTICACFGISRPMFNEMVEDALKKNGIVLENPAGEKSST